MNMKRKRDLFEEDQTLKRKKKQKCQHFQTEVKRDDETIKDSHIQHGMTPSIQDSQTVIVVSSIEMDKETPNLHQTAEHFKIKAPRQIDQPLELYSEEEHHNVGSLEPMDISDTLAPSSAPHPIETPDYLTPTLLLLIFNITLPTLDLYNDITMLRWLYFSPQYLAWGIFLFAGVFLNFLFTSLAWWRLEPRQNKSWTWVLLLLQVQPDILNVNSLLKHDFKFKSFTPKKFNKYVKTTL